MHGFLTRSKAFQAKDAVPGLQQAFHDCEAEFIQIAGREGLRDGTTAIVALIHDDTLSVAHVGDSRGVLCRAGGTAEAITQDHKPELEAEKRRIEALGGFVSYIGCWRTCLSRSRPLFPARLAPLRRHPFARAWASDSLPTFLTRVLPSLPMPLPCAFGWAAYRSLHMCRRDGHSRHVACHR